MFATEAVAYLRERLLSVRIALLWLLLLAATTVAAGPGADLPWLAVACALFVTGFRLWDDLADRDRDRLLYPGRVLVRTARCGAFAVLCVVLLTTVAIQIGYGAGPGRALALLALMAVMAVVYRLTAAAPSSVRPVRVALVLFKYPVLVLVLAENPGDGAVLAVAMVVYLVPLVDEARDGFGRY